MTRWLLLTLLLVPLSSCGKDPPDPGAPGGSGGSGGTGEPPFCGTGGVSKGPWSLSVDGTSAVIRWETCVEAPTRLTYGPEGAPLASSADGASTHHDIRTETKAILAERGADLAGRWWLHEVKLQGLAPSTCYAYEAAGERLGRFCTARKSGEPTRFAFIADTNPGLDDKAASSLLARIEAFQPDFSLHGGDMQYYTSALEPYSWWFGAMAPLFRSAPLWPAVGNHEMEKPDEFEDYYTRFWGKIGLDNQEHAYRFESAGIHFFSLNTEIDLKPGSPQLTWVADQLPRAAQQPGFRFSVVFLHRPLVTCGDTGDLVPEREALLPLFQKHGVRLVLMGHLHGYERFDLDGIPFVVAGGGGSRPGNVTDNLHRPLCGKRKAQGVFPHAVYFTVEGDTLEGTTIDDKEQVRDSFTIDLATPPK
jgi:hypothetical protein